jgi:hypothetical protein
MQMDAVRCGTETRHLNLDDDRYPLLSMELCKQREGGTGVAGEGVRGS